MEMDQKDVDDLMEGHHDKVNLILIIVIGYLVNILFCFLEGYCRNI